MTPNVFLGVVERVSKSVKPGARLRPFFQTSSDKKSWVAPEEEFLNSGVVSWWEPPPETEEKQIWTFQVEPSWSFDPSNMHHDAFMVRKGTPSPALELIVLPQIADLEDARSLLVESGIPLERYATRHLFFRHRSGLTIGPLDFTIRDGRLYVNERDTPLPLYQWRDDLGCAELDGHHILPIDATLDKIGEVDFSPTAVFLKHVLREIKDMPPALIEDAKLTKKLISQYSSALDKVSLKPSQAQRLKRLRKLGERASLGIEFGETAASELLSLPAVKKLVSDAKESAIRAAFEERRGAVAELDEQRIALEGQVERLQAEADRLHDAISTATQEQDALLTGFDARVQDKFEEIGRNATTFLANVAVLRAALSGEGRQKPATGPAVAKGKRPDIESLSAEHIVKAVRRRFEAAGLGPVLPSVLVSSWASGYVPMLFGALARDVLTAASESLFGGDIHFATLGPTMTSPADLLGIPVASPLGVSVVSEVVAAASRSDDLALLVFDNINLAQLDSLVVPLIRQYSVFHSECPSASRSMQYPTPLGMWPANLLLAGVLIDSPLALPMSREIWTYATLVDARPRRARLSAKAAEPRTAQNALCLGHEAWTEWLRSIASCPTSAAGLIAGHVSRRAESDTRFKRMSRRLADTIDHAAQEMSDEKRAGLLLEALVPYLLSRDVKPESILDGEAPTDVSTEDDFIDQVTTLFEEWGLEVR
jgi:hypothetical protein